MKKLFLLFGTVSISFILINCNDPKTGQQTTKTKEEKIEHGKYLAMTMGCHDCHTPKILGPNGPELDTANLLSGHPANQPLTPIPKDAAGWMLMNQSLTAYVGPWGISFAANLTSDTTGIGGWTFEQFKTAMTKGRYKGNLNNRMLLPPMPWQNFINAKEEDLMDLYEFFMSTRPVKNIVPNAVLPSK